jgi:hypothetical protein
MKVGNWTILLTCSVFNKKLNTLLFLFSFTRAGISQKDGKEVNYLNDDLIRILQG